MHKYFINIILMVIAMTAYASSTDIPDSVAIELPAIFTVEQIENCHQCVVLKEDNIPFAKLYPAEEHNDLFFLYDENNQKKAIVSFGTVTDDYGTGTVDSRLYIYTFRGKKRIKMSSATITYPMRGYGFSFFSMDVPYKNDKGYFVSRDDKYSSIEGYKSIHENHLAIRSKQALGRLRTKTYFRLYDYNKQQVKYELGSISKPLFTFSMDATVHVTNPKALREHIDPYAFYAVMAMYNNTDFLYAIEKGEPRKMKLPASFEILDELKQKIMDLATERQIVVDPNPQSPRILSDTFVDEYRNITGSYYWDRSFLTENEYLTQITDVACDLVKSNAYDKETEKDILEDALVYLKL